MDTPLDPLTMAMLNRQDWDEVLLKLEAAIIRYLQVTGGLDSLPQGLEPRDIAFKAVASLYTQERTWDYVKYPNVGRYLYYSVVRSQLNHLYNSKDSELVFRLQDLITVEDISEDTSEESTVGEKVDCSEMVSFEDEIHAQELLDKMRVALSGDKIAWEVLKLKILGCKDQEMAQRLELSVANVRAASKRITRVGRKLLPKER